MGRFDFWALVVVVLLLLLLGAMGAFACDLPPPDPLITWIKAPAI